MNITHAVDSYVLRQIAREFIAQDLPALFKHDDFMVHPNHMPIVRQSVKDSLEVIYDENPFQSALDQIADSLEKPRLTLLRGDAPKEWIQESNNFLQA